MGQDVIIAGLGNPGNKYVGTRHNVGFLIMDELAKRFGFEMSLAKYNAQYIRDNRWNHKICYIKPNTYMNLSGEAIARFVTFYKIPFDRILIIHDDIDMSCGRLKIVTGSGAGGHNGIRSLIQCLGTKDFYRLKFGVGRPGQSDQSQHTPVEKFVLGAFTKREETVVESRFNAIESGVELFVRGEISAAMNMINAIK